MRVSISKTGRHFSASPDQPVLQAALAAAVPVAHACRHGNCGLCRARLLQGEVHYPHGAPLGLSAAEAAEGYVLLCQAHLKSDIEIELAASGRADSTGVKRLPCRIVKMQAVGLDVMLLHLRLPPAEPLRFAAGQYVDILLSRGRRRSFSIASPPHESRSLELHVRRVPGGEFTEDLFAGSAAGRLLTLEGPLGAFAYRPGLAPLLLVGGGTGIAPLKSIWRHVVETGVRRPITVYWGVRGRDDLYAHEELEALQRTTPDFVYRPVLSEPDALWSGRSGWVHDAVIRDLGSLAGIDVYASGPPAMIAAMRADFARHGAELARLYYDAFDYAADTLERQRTNAHTKS